MSIFPLREQWASFILTEINWSCDTFGLVDWCHEGYSLASITDLGSQCSRQEADLPNMTFSIKGALLLISDYVLHLPRLITQLHSKKTDCLVLTQP